VLGTDEGSFLGPEEYLARKGGLEPGQLIRVYGYGIIAGEGVILVVGRDGRLYDAREEVEVDPNDVLDKKRAPDRWEFTGFSPESLPEDVLEGLVKEWFPDEFPEP